MQEINSTLEEQATHGRWIIVPTSNVFSVDEVTRVINFPVKTGKDINTTVIENSLKQLVAWADTAPRKHGKFYLSKAIIGKGRWTSVFPLFDEYLDSRFVAVGA